MRRREFIAAVASTIVSTHAVTAQVSAKRPLIAVLSAVTQEDNEPLRAFVRGLRELGYVEGGNLDIAYRYAEGRLERFPALAGELVRLTPAVIVALVTPAAVAARTLTRTIPIVCPLLADPVGLGLIANMSRPGGNVTGVVFRIDDLAGKQLELVF
jgi:putative ABC transport system substrate-binding protein